MPIHLTGKSGGRVTKGRRAVYRFHSLRHVAASLWIESGLPPKRIQKLIGHSSIKMTFDTYGHLFDSPDLVDAALLKMDEAVPA